MTKIPPKKLIEDKNLAYILGVIEGDGCIDRDYEIILNVNDKDFALTFKKVLENWTGFKVNIHSYNKQSTSYKVTLNSKIVVTYLKRYTTINKIEKVVKKVKGGSEFLQGMYDSEGCVGIKTIQISNNNKQLLLFCKKLLKNLDIESRKLRIGNKKGTPYTFPSGKTGFTNFNNYQFGITRRYNLINFKNLISFNIKRKQDKLTNELNSYIYKK